MTEKQIRRFWSRVQVGADDECWLWIGGHDGCGYGQMCVGNCLHKAHRLAWELDNGKLNNNTSLYHTCTNRDCCNPKHLYLPTQRDKTIERFWSNVKISGPDDCWVWTSYLFATGYGHFWGQGKQYKAHRYAWEITYGPIPAGEGHPGTCVCHRCDNKLCVNPKHLFLGTHADNQQDKQNKGRTPCGMVHWNCKLSASDVIAIRNTHSMTYKQMAEKYGVSTSHVGRIRQRLVRVSPMDNDAVG